MKIAVVSDSHDRIPMIKQAVELINKERCDITLHCGDIVSPFAANAFLGLSTEFQAVFGNNDGEKIGLQELFIANNWKLNQRPYDFFIGQFKIAMLHEPDNLQAYKARDDLSFVLYGHTHIPSIEKLSDKLIVNPGELCGWITGRSTLAIIDSNEMNAKLIE
ncbi:MAG: metallophosphoesterase, partial [Nitrospinota bacterium]